jgi:hypothetical protein
MNRVNVVRLERLARTLRGARTQAQHAAEGSRFALERLAKKTQKALDEPHAFVPMRSGRWCLRCGGAADRQALHPPELQGVTNHEAAAQAAGARG